MPVKPSDEYQLIGSPMVLDAIQPLRNQLRLSMSCRTCTPQSAVTRGPRSCRPSNLVASRLCRSTSASCCKGSECVALVLAFDHVGMGRFFDLAESPKPWGNRGWAVSGLQPNTVSNCRARCCVLCRDAVRKDSKGPRTGAFQTADVFPDGGL